MKPSTFILFLCLTLVGLTHCGRNLSSLAGIEFDSSVPADQRATMESDFKLLDSIAIATHKKASTFAMTDFTASSLRDWFYTRVHYVVGESFPDSSMKVPVSEQDSSLYETDEFSPLSATTIMENIGGTAYLNSKKDNKRYGILINGKTIKVDSPRVGVVKIGPGLFGQSQYRDNANPKAKINTVIRFATYLHEARHSDGRGDSVCFAHATCPEGHSLAGEFACDRFTNGPYMLAVAYLTAYYVSCTDCSTSDQNLLLLSIANNRSRKLGVQTEGDSEPESF